MLRPFIILALPRTGTKLLAEAIGSHPDIRYVQHEFRGAENKYWESPYVLSNYLKDWMLSDDITKIHLYRENSVDGAISLLLMSYTFPDGSFDLPVDEVINLARFRKERDNEFRSVSKWSFSYESLCDGKEIHKLPLWCSTKMCSLLGVSDHELITDSRKPDSKSVPRNNEELSWLLA